MKLYQLTEGISPIVYHLTSLSGVGKIISENRIRLSASFANDSEANTGSTKQFFLSTTRSKTGGYTMRNTGNQSAVLVLDGQKLGQNYKGGPVQYWSRGMIKMDTTYDELEDRIYHSEPYIPHADQYIKEIHAYVKDMNIHGRKAIMEVKRVGIPLFLYDNQKDFQLQNKAAAKPLKSFEVPSAEREPPYPRFDRIASKKQEKRRERQAGQINKIEYGMSRWVEFMTRPIEQWDRLHYTKRDAIRSMQYGGNDAINVLSADLHNAKNSPQEIAPMAKLMKKYKLRTAQDIIQFIAKRWEPVIHN